MFSLIKSIRARDPAQPTFFEVLLAYNGFHAVLLHRVSHWIWENTPLRALPRFLANISKIFTGIEIHPQAKIGKNLFIDHGTGVVIGQTAIIGDEVTIYHGVTLGGKGGDVAGKRHPTLEDGVIIGSGAQVLGDITIGKGSRVGANAVVIHNVPDGCTAVGNPARLVNCADDKGRAYGMPRSLVDPVGDTITGLVRDVQRLKEKAGLEPDKKSPKDGENYTDLWKGTGI